MGLRTFRGAAGTVAGSGPGSARNPRRCRAGLARDTGLGREGLYKALAPGAKPLYDTVIKLVRALGIELHAQPVHPGQV